MTAQFFRRRCLDLAVFLGLLGASSLVGMPYLPAAFWLGVLWRALVTWEEPA